MQQRTPARQAVSYADRNLIVSWQNIKIKTNLNNEILANILHHKPGLTLAVNSSARDRRRLSNADVFDRL